MDCHTAFRIYFIILKFSGIRRDFLVRYTGSEASVNPVGCNRSNFSLIRIVFTAFSCKRNNLEIQLLHDSPNLLLICEKSLIAKFSGCPPVSIILVLGSDLLNLTIQISIRIYAAQSLLPIHISCFWYFRV